MKSWTTCLAVSMASTAALIALYWPTSSGCYDTSILGHVRDHAYIQIKGTNVFLIDGENSPTPIGNVINENGKMVWHYFGQSSWSIDPKWNVMICTEVNNPTNRFILKRKPFRPIMVFFDRHWR